MRARWFAAQMPEDDYRSATREGAMVCVSCGSIDDDGGESSMCQVCGEPGMCPVADAHLGGALHVGTYT